jgi:electron transfer flavoprotein alpha subunit
LLDAGCVSEAVELELDGGQLVTGRYSLGGNTIAREVIRTPRQVIAVAPGTIDRAIPGKAASELVAHPSSSSPSRGTVVERRSKPARAIAGELACTRPLSYEYGWLPEDRMIGISGQKCSPQLLVSVGVSGQVQHTVGIQGARTIVAINTEKSAPILTQSDYAIIGDLYEVVPRLTARLRARRASGS